MEAKDWLKSIEKNLEIAQCTDREKYFTQCINYLEPLLIGGRHIATLIRTVVLSPGMSSKLDSEVITYPWYTQSQKERIL
jgi:hypothetical protein